MTLAPFETVVAEHGPVVLRVCRAVLGPQDAEDAWSETFLAACATNPLPVVVPCHRVVRSDGTPGGYVGGAAAKQMLLALESVTGRHPVVI